MAVYPDDVTFNTSLFSVIGSPVTYTNTGAQISFPLSTTATHKGEVVAAIDGVVQSTSLYSLSNNGNSISFSVAPVATSLTVTNIAVPENLTRTSTPIPTLVTEFSNSTVTTVDGNNYIINGVQTSWPFHISASPSSKDEMLVAIDGVLQLSSAFTFPSSVLGNRGIDISPALEFFNELQIRAFTASGVTTSVTDRCRGIIDKKPSKGFSTERAFDTSFFESQVGYEKRRLISRKSRRDWNLTYLNASGIMKESLDSFFRARSGSTESFQFDLTHINEESELVTVRFEGPLKYTHVQSRGTTPKDNFYNLQISLKEVYD